MFSLTEPDTIAKANNRVNRSRTRPFLAWQIFRVRPGYAGRWAIKPQNRNEPQVYRALDTLSALDAVSRARLRMTVGEALGAKHNSL